MTRKVKRQDLTAYLYGFTERCGRGRSDCSASFRRRGMTKCVLRAIQATILWMSAG